MAEERRTTPLTIPLRTTAARAAAIAACVVIVAAAYFSAKWGFANTASIRAENKDVAAYLAETAPSDPQTHYAAAVLLEKSFVPDDIDKALSELEQAVALSPNNYHLWLELGQARERSGMGPEAEQALRKALELAPSYARVKWSLGNFLVRDGRVDDGFALIRSAVAADPKLADPAALTAWQILDGNINEVRRTLGDSPGLSAALALILARQERFDDAAAVWSSIPEAQRRGELSVQAAALLARSVAAKRFRDAAAVAADIQKADGALAGKISNGGFESPLAVQGAGTFDWTIEPGTQPQIAATTGEKHSGSTSLVLIFNTTEGKEWRNLAQTVAVESGRPYRFQIFYRSDLKTDAELYWEAVDAVSGSVLARTEKAVGKGGWAPLEMTFTPVSDGVTIRLARDKCGVICRISGNLWFDDALLAPVGQ